MTKIPAKVRALAALFDTNFEDYKKPSFNETQLRRQFVDPLFEALGWDVGNTKGYSEQYKEVIHEDALRDEGRRKAPDYCFRIGKERKFFVEAKRPSVDLDKESAPSFQLRRYAWSAGLPLSIVTNFEQLTVYDTRTKPTKDDGPKIARILNFEYTEFDTRWEELANLFSKEAVLRGAFDKYAVSKRRGTSAMDRDFLATIENWRETLAKAIFKNNSEIQADELSFAVQAIIDRILFLRICEDKGIERADGLAEVCGKNAYANLVTKFRDAQRKYNAGLFHVYKEGSSDKSFEDSTAKLDIPDKVISTLIDEIYYPKSPYAFSVIPPDILGSVYERFLGSVISISGRTVKIELKPELKKAGGVYYTPSHIVRYMVSNSLKPILDKASSKDLPKVHILDMACGSGSFLIEAYDELVDWYLSWHIARGKPSRRYLQKIPKIDGKGHEIHLNLRERRRILIEHIFGVDIDPQAVEVTKLSLFLKLIEDVAVLPAQFEFAPFQSRILPDMDTNIRCGNSIVGADVYGTVSLSPDGVNQTRPFDWGSKDGFAEIMNSGRFDLVVGNPPYSYRNATFEQFKTYYATHYESTEGNFDTYKMFLERGVNLLRQNGTICQIVNSSFLIQPQFSKLREFLDTQLQLKELDVLGPKAFDEVTIDTAIIRGVRSNKKRVLRGLEVKEPKSPMLLSSTSGRFVSQARFHKNSSRIFDWRLSDREATMVGRLFDKFDNLASFCDLSVGINTGMMKSELVAAARKDARYHPCVRGDGLTRYGECETTGWILYDPDVIRAAGSRGRSLPPERYFTSDKILVVRTRNTSLKRRIIATLDRKKKYNLNRLSNIVAKPGTDIWTILGIVNSELWNFIFSTRFFNYEIKPVFLKEAPVASKSDGKLGALARERKNLEEEFDLARLETQRKTILGRVESLERRIDDCVADLFGLSREEIANVRETLSSLPGT